VLGLQGRLRRCLLGAVDSGDGPTPAGPHERCGTTPRLLAGESEFCREQLGVVGGLRSEHGQTASERQRDDAADDGSGMTIGLVILSDDHRQRTTAYGDSSAPSCIAEQTSMRATGFTEGRGRFVRRLTRSASRAPGHRAGDGRIRALRPLKGITRLKIGYQVQRSLPAAGTSRAGEATPAQRARTRWWKSRSRMAAVNHAQTAWRQWVT